MSCPNFGGKSFLSSTRTYTMTVDWGTGSTVVTPSLAKMVRLYKLRVSWSRGLRIVRFPVSGSMSKSELIFPPAKRVSKSNQIYKIVFVSICIFPYFNSYSIIVSAINFVYTNTILLPVCVYYNLNNYIYFTFFRNTQQVFISQKLPICCLFRYLAITLTGHEHLQNSDGKSTAKHLIMYQYRCQIYNLHSVLTNDSISDPCILSFI